MSRSNAHIRFSLFCVMLLGSGGMPLSAQKEVRLLLRDSLLFACSELSSFKDAAGYPDIVKRGDQYYAYDPLGKRFHVFEKDASCMRHYQVKGCQEANFHKAMAFEVTSEGHYFAWFKNFVHYREGRCVWEEYLGSGEKGFAFSQRLRSDPSLRIDTVRDRAIMPIIPSPPDSVGGNVQQYRKAYYRSYEGRGLLALYPLEDLDGKNGGEPSGYIGAMAPIYKEKEFLPHLDHLNWAMDQAEGKLFIGQMASPKVRVYDMQGEQKEVLGQKGKALGADDTVHSLMNAPRSAKAQQKKEWKRKVLSPTYGDLYYSDEHELLFRVYKAYSKEQKDTWEGKDYRWEQWFERQLLKPAYLQIYDTRNGGRLLFDRRMGKGPFRILDLVDNTLFVNRGCPKAFAPQKLKVLEYELVR